MIPYTISPSQITTYRECQRKWAWRAIAKIKVPDKPSAALGTRIHKALEGYLRGDPWDYSSPEATLISEIAINGIHHLPRPNAPGVTLEGHFLFEVESTGERINYQGYRDVTVEDSIIVPGCAGGAPAVIDHKSTGDFRWAKTPEALRTDPQGVIYAYEAMAKFRSPVVDLVWIYYRTRGANASKRVHLRVYSPDVTKEFQALQVTGLEISTIHRTVTNPLDLPPNRDACDGFGGCPYRVNCTDLATFSGGAPMTQGMQDMFSRLKAGNGAAGSATPAPQPPVPAGIPDAPAATSHALPAGITDAPEGFVVPPFLAAKSALPIVIPAPPALTIEQQIAALQAQQQQQALLAAAPPAAPVAINPPGEASPPAPTPPPIPIAATPSAEKPKRARRTNAQIAADKAAEEAAANPPAPVPVVAPKPIQEVAALASIDAAPAPVKKTVQWLYLDCSPNHQTTNASEVFAMAKALIRQKFDVDDYRLIKYTGAAALSEAFLYLVDNGSVEDLCLDTRTPEGLIVLEDLVARAEHVVRGMR